MPIDGTKATYGVITSTNYPQWIPNERCRLVINGASDKVIRVYVSDLSTEEAEENGDCDKSSLSFYSGNIATRYCGDKKENGNYVFISCSNSLEILWHSSSIASAPFRGFNIYYEGSYSFYSHFIN